MTQVRCGTAPPWPTNANWPGVSLQLIDPTQDNWRVANWAANSTPGLSATPGATNTVLASLPPFQSPWINEVQAQNLTGLTNRLGQRTAWIELFNPGTNALALNGLYLSDDYSNLTNWAFPPGAIIHAGQFLVVFADGQAGLSTTNELHTGFALPAGSGSLALSRLTNGQQQTLDYLDYTNLPDPVSNETKPDQSDKVKMLEEKGDLAGVHGDYFRAASYYQTALHISARMVPLVRQAGRCRTQTGQSGGCAQGIWTRSEV